ncbi:uncharacterized protein RCC_07700 [Ramularia collo-cygni]|uniref:Uncharacterized protein n=1 Tax=Ramularia collo-cygni TaxID=112498 RepID=A0A2D3VL08_9PEZI|nr:uncharacterized protein RCC_07700 [Ramularia collo-cygni]CZT21833.1 uncharacterized protein RCC_07700 [Ramularia collo-cygni]
MGVISVKDIPSVVLLLVSSIVSISYVILHTTTTRLNTSARNMMQCERADTLRSLARFTLRVLATLWLISAALSITATTSRQPLCVLSTTSAGTLDVMPLDKGVTCILNRTGILASFVAL